MGGNLGPFALGELLGRGGMGEVYAGTHVTSDTPVAIKVITGERASSPGYVEAFRREVRAVAALSHPTVVQVLDYGRVEGDVAGLTAGASYLVMERADGTLASRCGRLGWDELRAVVLELLDALAHVHARGVVHLDLKPSNVLLGGARPGLKLSDFGVALWDDEEREPVGVTGTPAYMAPEQIAGSWRDLGPWTDLYALGCMTYALATGSPPGRTVGDPPPIGGPAPLGPWVRRLLAPDPRGRFRRAADAAAALRGIAPGRAPAFAPSRVRVVYRGETETADGWTPSDAPLPAPEIPHPGSPDGAFPLPEPPADWRAAAVPEPRWMRGVGLGLYGLRQVGIVGRTVERDALWGALLDVTRTRTARVVVLEGHAGVGKSRLAQWIACRAHEVGAATALHAVYSDPPGPRDGVAAMFERALMTAGLPRPAVAERVASALSLTDPADVGAVTELLRPRGQHEPTAGVADVPLPTEEARRAVARRLLGWLSAERPLVIWLDDVQWSPDAVRLAAELAGLPALLVLTVRAEAVGPEMAALLATLDATRLPVAPLGEDDGRRLVSELLGVTGDIAAAVGERAGGNPLFAVHLVGDWVRRGLLVAGAEGFDLAPGADVTLPDAIHTLWRGRVDHLLSRHPGAAVPLLAAGALGTDVALVEWRAVCEALGAPAPDGLVEALAVDGLAREQHGGFAFTHRMLVESLVRMAEERDLSARIERETGRVLGRRGADASRRGDLRDATGLLTRAARHLASSGHPELTGVLAALGSAQQQLGDPDGARATLSRALALADGAPPSPEEAAAWDALGCLDRALGRMDEAMVGYRRALEVARSVAAVAWEGSALNGLAGCHVDRGDLGTARETLESALRLDLDDPALNALLRLNLASVLSLSGERDRALELAEQTLARCRSAGIRHFAGRVLGQIGGIHLHANRLAEAVICLEEARDIAASLGAVRQEAHAEYGLGLAARARGDLDGASAALTSALEKNRRIGDRRWQGVLAASVASVNLEWILAGQQFLIPTTRALLVESEALLKASGGAGDIALGYTHIFRAALETLAGDRDASRAASNAADAIGSVSGPRARQLLDEQAARLRVRFG